MKLQLFCFLSLMIFLSGGLVHAQHENVWAFGENAGLDFNVSPPIAIKTNINTREGSASICDSKGQLLFYTDGTDLWDRNHNIMPNGKDLTGLGMNVTASTTQGALIIHRPGNAWQYYVFSLGAESTTENFCLLYYSVVDMRLNNGLGDVLPGNKAIRLDSLLTEHLTAVSGNDCNVWLLVISRTSQAIKSYRVDINGIDHNPGISPGVPGGGMYTGVLGSIDVSPDRSMLAVTQGNLLLFDFDPGSGKATRPFVLDKSWDPYYYGVCFSPDNTQLYASTSSTLNQFDLRSSDSVARSVSKTLLASNVSYPAIRRGPDGKVYLPSSGSAFLNVINLPNLNGRACQYTSRGMSLLPGTKSQLGLPNLATIISREKVINVQTDTVFCFFGVTLTAKNLAGIDYVWNDGRTGAQRTVDTGGVFWVTYQVAAPCMFDECTDTFKVTRDFSRKLSKTSTSLIGWCPADTLLLTASNFNGARYAWQDNQSGMQRRVNQSGLYVLRYSIDSLCTDFEDLFQVSYPEADYKVSFTADTLVCMEEALSFRNTSAPYYEDFKWWFGDGDAALGQHATHAYSRGGLYDVILVGKINARCVDTAYAQIVVDSPLSNSFAFHPERVCVGTAVEFKPQLQHPTMVGLHWQFGDNSSFFSGIERGIQHAYEIPGSLSVMLTSTFRACPANTFIDTVYVYAIPEVYLGRDSSLCGQGAFILLKNVLQQADNTYKYLWNTGDTTAQLRVSAPGTYSLRVQTEPLGCTGYESIEINKDCFMDIPNAFTPNGDGVNDYFFPWKWLSDGIVKFHLQIFNRWGQLLFATNEKEGLGWDGKWNAVEQATGLYIFRVDAVLQNGHREHHEGNVTLLR